MKKRGDSINREELPEDFYWGKCPHCKNPKMVLLRKDTILKNFPAYCKRCKGQSIITIEPKSRIVNRKY